MQSPLPDQVALLGARRPLLSPSTDWQSRQHSHTNLQEKLHGRGLSAKLSRGSPEKHEYGIDPSDSVTRLVLWLPGQPGLGFDDSGKQIHRRTLG